MRDAAAGMYWASHESPSVIMKRDAAGRVSVHARGDFRDVRWMTVTPEGILFLIDKGDLRRVSPTGTVTTLARKLSSRRPAPANVTERHYHQGLWSDGDGGVFVAVSEEKVVMRVRRGGAPEVVKATGPEWSPSGGLLDRRGNLWILEYRANNDMRARRINRDGTETLFDPNRR